MSTMLLENETILFTKSSDGRYTFISPEGSTFLGLTEGEILGHTDLELFGPEVGFDSLEIEQRVLITGQSQITMATYPVQEQYYFLQVTRHAHRSTDGKFSSIIGSMRLAQEAEADLPSSSPQPEETTAVQTAAEPAGLPPLADSMVHAHLLSLPTAVAAITSTLSETHILETLTWEITNLLDVDGCTVYRWDQVENRLNMESFFRSDGQPFPQQQTSINLSRFPFLLRIIKERYARQLKGNQVRAQSAEELFLAQITEANLLLLPLVFQEKMLGVIQVIPGDSGRTFSEQEVSMTQLLTDQAASSLVNARLYEELNIANRSLKTSNAELDSFAHTVAHDLKSPLGSIIGFADLICKGHEGMAPGQLQEFLEIISRNARKMHTIIDGLLTLASVRREEVELSPLPMETIVHDVKSRLYYMMRQANADLIITDDWPIAVGYIPWVEEVWANHINNAIKYGGRPPHIIVGADPQSEGQIRFWVRDNGSGLTKTEQEKLFMPFTRLGEKSVSGNGLGLSIVHRIITRLGGTVGVHSEPGNGSEFFFTLPASESTL